MPLPTFENYRAVWIEKTKSSHGHGGEGWEFGTCLWSPTVSETKHRIYKNMERAGRGDLVLHFYKDTPFGRDGDYYFCGISTVAAPVRVLETEPPQPGDWAGRGQYFRIEVENFVSFTEPLSISDFIAMKCPSIFEGPPAGEPSFVLNDGKARLAQGKYLASCPKHLYELLSSSIDEAVTFPVLAPAMPKEGEKSAEKPFDYEDLSKASALSAKPITLSETRSWSETPKNIMAPFAKHAHLSFWNAIRPWAKGISRSTTSTPFRAKGRRR